MAEGYASQQVKDLKNNSRKNERLKFFDRKNSHSNKKKRIPIFLKEENLSEPKKNEIKKKIADQQKKEKIKNFVLLIISIFVTILLFKILFAPFKEVL